MLSHSEIHRSDEFSALCCYLQPDKRLKINVRLILNNFVRGICKGLNNLP